MIGDSTPAAKRRSFLKAVGAAGATTALGGVAGADTSEGTKQYIVGLNDTFDVQNVESELLSASDLPDDYTIIRRNEVLNYAIVEPAVEESEMDLATFETNILAKDDVKYLEEDEAKWQPLEVDPNDRLFSDQYAPQQVRAPIAWEETQGSADVTVAVVDQGVMYDHPDLESQFGSNKGKDFVTVEDSTRDDDPMPDDLANEYHGTHVAGIVAAGIDNDTGTAGMSDATLLSCRALGLQGGKTADIADAVQWATDQGADLINMSLGGGGYSDTMKNAVSYAVNNGCLPICAAGNAGKEGVSYPAGYNECMAISAIDSDLELASFSQYGDKIDLAAPGVNVLSCWTQEKSDYNGKYNAISGTSMACPATCGVAALAKSEFPEKSPTELRQHLKDTAVDIGLSENEQGAGRVDAAQAVQATGDDDQDPTATARPSITDPHEQERVTFLGSDSDDAAGYIADWAWDLGDGTTATGEKVEYKYDTPGEYTVELTVTDDDGATATDTVDITVQEGTCAEGPVKNDSWSGSLSPSDSQRDMGRHSYSWQTNEPCELEVSYTYPDSQKWVGFVIQGSGDGRDVFTGESITLLSSDIDSSKSLTVGVLAQKGAQSGDYSIDLEEHGFAQDGGEPEPEPPTADISLSSNAIETGEELSVDASGSSDPDGSITKYTWSFDDGTSASGATATHTYESAGEYTVSVTVRDDDGKTDKARSTVTVTEPNQGPTASLAADASSAPVGSDVTFDASGSTDADGTIESYEWRVDGSVVDESVEPMFTTAFDDAGEHDVSVTVTDDDDATDSDSVTVTVEETGGECGDDTATDGVGGVLRGWWDDDSYTYTMETDDPCRITFTLSGRGRGSDFDLYLTLDGRTPTTYDFDRRSITVTSDEQITVEDVDPDSEIGILVDSYSGGGRYSLSVEEIGQ